MARTWACSLLRLHPGCAGVVVRILRSYTSLPGHTGVAQLGTGLLAPFACRAPAARAACVHRARAGVVTSLVDVSSSTACKHRGRGATAEGIRGGCAVHVDDGRRTRLGSCRNARPSSATCRRRCCCRVLCCCVSSRVCQFRAASRLLPGGAERVRGLSGARQRLKGRARRPKGRTDGDGGGNAGCTPILSAVAPSGAAVRVARPDPR